MSLREAGANVASVVPGMSLREAGANVASVVLTYPNGEAPPAEVKLGWQHRQLRPYVPEPRRCFNCQKFSHVSKYCRKQQPVCPVCSEGHKYEDCPNKDHRKCANCGGNHSASYKKCPTYVEMRDILKHMTLTGQSFSDSKKSLKESSIVDQGPVHVGLQGELATSTQPTYTTQTTNTSQTTNTAETTNTVQTANNAQSYAAAVTSTDQQKQKQTNTIPTQTTNNSNGPELEEGDRIPPPVQGCGCAAGSSSNLTKFILLMVQVIIQTVQDKEQAQTLSDVITKSTQELLGLTSAETSFTPENTNQL